ncbi:unnamed protein product [Trifolium pratense]|uniref:Uncharacterized protein n=1 Tax=Trifolium pratense TaxID=57577 RepID=A0ACB0KY46_TRIPR|nr:unnamed protein product [Trifolium pratense]
MGKHLINSEESTQIQEVNQGCMWGMFNILDYHHWGVKKVFHHKKKRHNRYKRKITLQEQQNVVTEAESHLVSQHREISSAKGQTSSENALHQKKDGNTTESSLKRDISIKFKNNDDVLELISVEKNLLLKFLKDIDFGGKKYHKASHNKATLTKSGSFPLPASSKTKNISSSTFRAKQTEIWDFPKGEKLRVGTHVPKKFGSSSVKDISYEMLKPSATDNGIDSVVAVEQKSSISTWSSDGLNHKGWNQVVTHQFKVIKQKIKHAIVELKKSGHSKTSPEYSNIDNEKEISQSLDDGAIHEYKKSRSLGETKASESGSNKHEPRLMRRTSSLNESMDRYTQLFEKSLSKEVKWQSSKSKSLRLTNDDKTQKSKHARIFSRSNLSMPNLEALGFILHEALLETNDIGNNTVESDNDVQSKSVSLSLKNDKSTDHFKEAEIDETVEGSGRDVNPSPRSLSDKMVEEIDEGVTCDQREDIHEPASEQEGKESNTRGSNASVTAAEDTNKSLETDILHFKSYSETDSNFKYVKDILEYSGFTRNEQAQMRYTVDQPIKPSLFTALEESLLHENEYSGEENTNICDRQLLFNLINEVLFQMYEKSPTYFPKPFAFNYKLKSMPKGNYLVNEVWNNVSSYLSLRPELDETLDDVVGRDLTKGTGWMNLQQEEECVALELEDMIIDDLLDEIIFSFV